MLRILIVFILLLPTVANAKYYNGSSWGTDTAKYYNGSAWVTCAKKYYNGSAWVEIEAAGGSCATDAVSQATTTYEGLTVGSASGTVVFAGRFTTTSEITNSCGVDVFLETVGSPTFTLTAYIYTESAGEPGTQVANAVSTTRNSAELDSAVDGAWQPFLWSGASPTLAASTNYYVVLVASTYNATNYWKWKSDSLSTSAEWKAASVAGPWTTQGARNMALKIKTP